MRGVIVLRYTEAQSCGRIPPVGVGRREKERNVLTSRRPRRAAGIWLALETGLPLKVEFYSSRSTLAAGEKPLRTMGITGFSQLAVSRGLPQPLEQASGQPPKWESIAILIDSP